MNLIAPAEFWELAPEERDRICNGCGPAGWRVDPIPDSIWGLDITPACNIHDFMYHQGHDKQQADITFLANMVILCAQGSKWLLPLRLVRCCTYFLAVFFCGDSCFGADEGRQ